MAGITPPRAYRFGVFELDVRAGELRKHGIRVKLYGQPFQVLQTLLERAGDVVTREELRAQLWPADTFVDFDHGLNTCVNRLRETLGDAADSPRFIETVPRRGYRFIAPVTTSGAAAAVVAPAAELPAGEGKPASASIAAREPLHVLLWQRWHQITGVILLLAVGAYFLSREFGGQVVSVVHAPGKETARRQMLVVLPFENLGEDAANAFFSDGLTEEMIAQLGRLHPQGLGVIARTSSMQYRKTQKTAFQIGNELGVDFILEGSVRREAGRVRIVARLVNVRDQAQLWADTYDRKLDDVLAIQHDVARRTATALQLELLPAQQAALGKIPAVSAAAYESYLRGRYLWNTRSEDGLRKSVAYLGAAIQQEPGFALAHAGLADAFNVLGYYGYLPPADAFARAKAAARRALELDDSLAEAHTALAYAAHYHDFDWAQAESEFQRAIVLNANYPAAHQWHAAQRMALGDFSSALAEMEAARRLDPLSLIINAGLGWIQYHARDYAAAEKQLKRVLELDANFVPARIWLGDVYLATRRPAEALAEFTRAHQLAGESPAIRAELAQAQAASGRAAEALLSLAQLEALARTRSVEASSIARVYAALGRTDSVMGWLERGRQQRDVRMVLLAVDPQFDSLRGDPRFKRLLEAMKLPQVELKKR